MIDDHVFSLNNFKFGGFVDCFFPIEFEMKGYHIQLGLHHTWNYNSKLTLRTG